MKPNTILGIVKNKTSFFLSSKLVYTTRTVHTYIFQKTLKIVGYFWFETGSYYIAQADLKFSILLPQPSRVPGLYQCAKVGNLTPVFWRLMQTHLSEASLVKCIFKPAKDVHKETPLKKKNSAKAGLSSLNFNSESLHFPLNWDTSILLTERYWVNLR